MDNSSYCSGSLKAVKKNSSLPDCRIYPNTFQDSPEERNRLPYPKLDVMDFNKKHTIAEIAKEIKSATEYCKRLKRKRDFLFLKEKSEREN